MRRIVVTGAASGVGAAIARRFAGPGVRLLLHTRRNAAGLARVAAEASATGAEVETVFADLAEDAAAARIIDLAVARWGGVDVLLANAGFADRTKFADLSEAALAHSVTVIQTGFFRLCQTALPHLPEDARVIAVSSFVAHLFRTDITTFPASAAAKAGLEALVRSLAIELAPRRITVNAVAPGFVEKDSGAHRAIGPEALAAQLARIPLGRIGRPADIAAAVAFLASPDAAYITGQTLRVDGGLVMGP
jgi:NAD(P)-dependent dehydrogenase (short-subunit alcohol dehydrogenase family)